MKLRSSAVRGALVVLALAGIGAFLYGILPSPVFDLSWGRSRVIQVMPESSPEWTETHILGPDSTEVRTEVVYRNGDYGTRQWRPDHTLSHEVIRFADGSDRLQADYAADGKQVLKGFALRSDRSTIWTAQEDDRQYVTMTTYWTDGKTVFRTQRRKQGSARVEERYFYRDGKPWMRYEGSLAKDADPSIEEVWSEAGKPVFLHQAGLNETSQDSYFRDDGTLAYKQYWGTFRYGYQYRSSSTYKVLLTIEVYAADGVRVQRKIIMNSGGYAIDRVVDCAADGSTTESSVSWDGTVSTITKYDKNGKQLKQEDVKPGSDAPKILIEDKLKASALGTFDPTEPWQQQETANGDATALRLVR